MDATAIYPIIQALAKSRPNLHEKSTHYHAAMQHRLPSETLGFLRIFNDFIVRLCYKERRR
jgi:hypothetical protein